MNFIIQEKSSGAYELYESFWWGKRLVGTYDEYESAKSILRGRSVKPLKREIYDEYGNRAIQDYF